MLFTNKNKYNLTIIQQNMIAYIYILIYLCIIFIKHEKNYINNSHFTISSHDVLH